MYEKFQVGLSSVNVTEKTKQLVNEVLDKGAIGQSEYIEQFEKMVADYVGSKFCIAVSSGTMADAVAVAVMRELYNVQGAILPALTFIAQPNSVRYNSLNVNFVDVDSHGILDYNEVKINDYIDHPNFLFVNDIMGQLASISKHTFMIEDACEAFGTTYKGKFAGTFGLMGTYSFYPSHTITTGEGGAIVTDNPDVARLCRSVRNHGRSDAVNAHWPLHKFDFPRFGFNAKMNGLQAAIGISMMENIEEYINRRKTVYKKLKENLGCGFDQDKFVDIVPHGFPICFKDHDRRDRAINKLSQSGIESRPLFSCIPNKEKYYMDRNCNVHNNFHMSTKIAKTVLYLPCHQNLTDGDIEYITRVFQDIIYEKDTQL